MNIRRLVVLFGKELKYAAKSYFMIFSVVAPIALTLLVNLLFGSIFSGKPKLGVLDPGNSTFLQKIVAMKSINIKIFFTEKELKNAVATGSFDMGILLPENIDSTLANNEKVQISAFVWGQSLLKDRALIRSALTYEAGQSSKQETPIDIVMISLGEGKNIPWKERFFPIIILMAIFISGFTIPSSLLVEEKQKQTLGAILTTPVTQSEVFISKGVVGVLISLIMSIVTLILNNAIHNQFGLIIFILFLGAIMAAQFGLLLGAFVSEMATLYSTIKGLGIFLYAPGIVTMFPQLPQWICKLFPTYYIINPIFTISQNGGNWSTVKSDIFLLFGFLTFLMIILMAIARKTK